MKDATRVRKSQATGAIPITSSTGGAPATPTVHPNTPLGPPPTVETGGTPFVTRSSGRPKRVSITQVIPFAADQAKSAATDAFKSRNAGTWSFGPVDLFGMITTADNSATPGADAKLTADQATSIAHDALVKNADLLGFAPDDLPAMKAAPLKSWYGWSVEFEGTHSPPGYENIDSVTRQLSVEIKLNADGTLRGIDDQSAMLTTDNLIPGLSISTKPGLAADSSAVTKAVVGRSLEWVTGGDEGQPKQVTKLGKVAAADITSRKLELYQDWDQPGKLTLTLAYDVRVNKGGHTFSFMVDAGTGKMIANTQIE